jgi:hypothetical protein
LGTQISRLKKGFMNVQHDLAYIRKYGKQMHLQNNEAGSRSMLHHCTDDSIGFDNWKEQLEKIVNTQRKNLIQF